MNVDFIDQPCHQVEKVHRQTIGSSGVYLYGCNSNDERIKDRAFLKLAEIMQPGQTVELNLSRFDRFDGRADSQPWRRLEYRLDYVIHPQPQFTAQREMACYNFQLEPIKPMPTSTPPKPTPPPKTGIAKIWDDFYSWHKKLTDYL